MTIKTYGTPLFSYIRAIQFHCRVTTQVRPHTHKWSELIGWHFWGVRLQTDTHPHNCHWQLTVRPALFFTVLFCKIYYKSKAAKLSAPLFGTGLIIIESRTYNANCCYCVMYVSWSRTSSILLLQYRINCLSTEQIKRSHDQRKYYIETIRCHDR